jgi:hypothetical protein
MTWAGESRRLSQHPARTFVEIHPDDAGIVHIKMARPAADLQESNMAGRLLGAPSWRLGRSTSCSIRSASVARPAAAVTGRLAEA